MDLALSVLDLSVLSAGRSSSDALTGTTVLAQAADRLGYRRFWVAEHHNMPSVACTAPPVLIAHLAANTSRIRVGSGGVMLPNHAPLAVAEQFAMLEALHPGRIDLGVGRAPGTDGSTARVLRRGATGDVDDFPNDLVDVMGLLGDVRTGDGLWRSFRATPIASSSPDVFLLGSSDYGARLAAHLGLPYSYAHHFDMAGGDNRYTINVAALYRQQFRPSQRWPEPHFILTATALAAETAEEAEWHALPGRITALGRRTGRFTPLPSPEDAARHPEVEEARALPTGRLVGDAETVWAGLEELAALTSADEVMVTSVAYDTAARVRSLEVLAARAGLVAGV